jgi:hypothetical protein
LDEAIGGVVAMIHVVDERPQPLGRLPAAGHALDEQPRIRRARLVSAKAEAERVLQVVDVEVL